MLFVIITDGMENSSCEYSYDNIRSLIEEQKNKHNWEFIFLGANIDAVEVAGRCGIAKNRAQNFINDRVGISLNYCVVNEVISNFRKSENHCISDDWSMPIAADYKRRSKKL